MDLSNVSKGSFRLRAGMEPATAPLEEQPFPVITIVPFSLQEVVEKGDNDEVMVSSCSKRRHGGEMPSSPLFIVGFE